MPRGGFKGRRTRRAPGAPTPERPHKTTSLHFTIVKSASLLKSLKIFVENIS